MDAAENEEGGGGDLRIGGGVGHCSEVSRISVAVNVADVLWRLGKCLGSPDVRYVTNSFHESEDHNTRSPLRPTRWPTFGASR